MVIFDTNSQRANVNKYNGSWERVSYWTYFRTLRDFMLKLKLSVVICMLSVLTADYSLTLWRKLIPLLEKIMQFRRKGKITCFHELSDSCKMRWVNFLLFFRTRVKVLRWWMRKRGELQATGPMISTMDTTSSSPRNLSDWVIKTFCIQNFANSTLGIHLECIKSWYQIFNYLRCQKLQWLIWQTNEL